MFQSLLKWFNNNGKGKKGRTKASKPQIKGTPSTPTIDMVENLSWAKLHDQVKFFNDITSGNMEIQLGHEAFMASQDADEESITKE